ncbi:hypothetical protein M8C21_028716, partial [Ambrosia artemisiifolia]
YGPGVDVWAAACIFAALLLRRPFLQMRRFVMFWWKHCHKNSQIEKRNGWNRWIWFYAVNLKEMDMRAIAIRRQRCDYCGSLRTYS